MERRRTLGMEGKSVFEPFYSDFPELTEKGMYNLTPQTDETSVTNMYAVFGEKAFSYIGGTVKNSIFTVVVLDDYTVIYARGVQEGVNLVYRRGYSYKGVKLKACDGAETNKPTVTYYVEKIL